MRKNYFRLPKNLVKEWPEVFSGMYMNTLPEKYLLGIRLVFSNGSIWEISTDDNFHLFSDNILERIIELINEDDNSIMRIDLQLDIQKIKIDTKKSIEKIFKE